MMLKLSCCGKEKIMEKICPVISNAHVSCYKTRCAWYIAKKDKCAIWVCADILSANKKNESKKS